MPTDDYEYKKAHAAVHRARGKARDQDCVDCGKQALDWSHKHDSEPTDPQNYEPRCRSCHKKYDGAPESMAGNKRAAKPRSEHSRRNISIAAMNRKSQRVRNEKGQYI